MRKMLFLLLLAVTALPALAQDEAAREGLRIAREMDRRASGFGNLSAELVMVLMDRSGRKSLRQLRNLVRERPDDGDLSLMVFEQPADVRGTRLLVHAHKDRDDDEWIYLPALRRVKRISAAGKTSSFMGSEFTYEDLGAQEVEKFDHRLLRTEPCGVDDLQCFVNERRPRLAGSGYSRQVLWIDQQEYRPWRIDYYDRKGELLKTLLLRDYHRYLDHYWRAHRMLMKNHQTGKSTLLLWKSFRFGNEFPPDTFDPKRLASGH
ncbi:MAG: outer membrane lipoprotein-sorting protein [Gammaproteobacteria bacterium]|nr:MAG: outer membrane lipoprotein-sorting protein [Gammaproteobacteria bacterium]